MSESGNESDTLSHALMNPSHHGYAVMAAAEHTG